MNSVSLARTRGDNLIEITLESFGQISLSLIDLDMLLDGLWIQWAPLIGSTSVVKMLSSGQPEEFDDEQIVDCARPINFGHRVKVTIRLVTNMVDSDEFIRMVSDIERSVIAMYATGRPPQLSSRDFVHKSADVLTPVRLPSKQELQANSLPPEETNHFKFSPLLPLSDQPNYDRYKQPVEWKVQPD